MTKHGEGPTDEMVEWLKSPRKPVWSCQTCKEFPQILEDIEMYRVMLEAGETNRSLRELWGRMQTVYGYKFGYGALRKHFVNCRQDV